jgi:glycosyltransferase involved in cell wall biosynthesis
MPWGSDILTEPDNSYIRRNLVKKVMKTCDHVQCDAEFVKKKIMDDYGLSADMITVFPWGIDLEMFKKSDKQSARKQLKLEPGKFIVLFNRYLENIYGVQYLLEAFNSFASGKDDVQLLMLSDGSGKNDVLKYITDKGLDDKITLVGRVPNFELPVFLNAADVYISTSLSDGASLSLLEAMACGTGIIVSDVPAIREWINNENGFIVPVADTAETARSLEELYLNRQLIEDQSAKNIAIAKKRADWNINFLKLKDIYNRLLK